MTSHGKCWIKKEEELFYPRSENKAANPLCSCCEAVLRLCFRLGKNPVFSLRGSFLKQIGTSSSYPRDLHQEFAKVGWIGPIFHVVFLLDAGN